MRDIGGYHRKVYTFTMVTEFSRASFEMHSTGMDQKATLACQQVPDEIGQPLGSHTPSLSGSPFPD